MAKRAAFQILRLLGSGGMGEVFLAQMTSGGAGEQVALKRIRSGLLAKSDVLSQFQRECRIGSLLHNEHIVALRAYGQDRDGPYMAMEYVDGVPASALAQAATPQQPHLPVDVALCIAADAAEGLRYAHSFLDDAQGIAGVIHRDISPENILVGRDGRAKVSDFGIAKVRGATTITETGTVKGKFPYMAPELFHGAAADVQTDVFAFGATLFTLLCGIAPFHGRTEADTIRAVLYGTPPRASSLIAGVPLEIDAWIAAALEKDRGVRPKDLSAAARLLSGYQSFEARQLVCEWVERAAALKAEAQVEFNHVASTQHVGAPRPRRHRAAGLGAAAVVLALAIAAGAYWLWPGDVPPAVVAAPPVNAPALTRAVPLPPQPEVPSKPVEEEPAPVPKATPVAPKKLRLSPAHRTGKLRVKVMPWAEAFVNGEHVGKTPFAPLTLAEGTHSVILVNNELGVRKQYQVKVSSGKETVLKVSLEKTP
jgi:eukaryotic-like serine/threonine-protein kinase